MSVVSFAAAAVSAFAALSVAAESAAAEVVAAEPLSVLPQAVADTAMVIAAAIYAIFFTIEVFIIFFPFGQLLLPILFVLSGTVNMILPYCKIQNHRKVKTG